MASIAFRGKTYQLATTLRVAFNIQGRNGHKPYTQVFEGIGEMGIEKQLEIVYVAFEVANKEYVLAEKLTYSTFLEEYLDSENFTLKDMMACLEEIVHGIMGTEKETEPEPEQLELSETSGN